mgnify:FL=1
MKQIKQTKQVSGGNPALQAAAATVTAVAAVATSFEYFIEKGQQLGQKIYENKHPDSGLGKMEYKKEDYHPAYLEYKHPNNDYNVHGHFGNF